MGARFRPRQLQLRTRLSHSDECVSISNDFYGYEFYLLRLSSPFVLSSTVFQGYTSFLLQSETSVMNHQPSPIQSSQAY